jgi:hypothetical protein
LNVFKFFKKYQSNIQKEKISYLKLEEKYENSTEFEKNEEKLKSFNEEKTKLENISKEKIFNDEKMKSEILKNLKTIEEERDLININNTEKKKEFFKIKKNSKYQYWKQFINFNYEKRELIGFIIIGGFLYTILIHIYFLIIKKPRKNLEYQKSEEYKRNKGVEKILEPYNSDIDPDYVQRNKIEEFLNNNLNNKNDFNMYIIFFGEKGSGKMTLLNHVIHQKKGIIRVKINGEMKTNIGQAFLSSIDIPIIESWNKGIFYLKIK